MSDFVVRGFLGLLALFAAIFVVLFLGGLCSAYLEGRREKRAGLPISRPAWELRDKRKARGGGYIGAIRHMWADAKSPMSLCWCGRGPIAEFRALGATEIDGYGCVAWEGGDPEAIRRHDAAGGYARVPVKS